MRVFRLLAALCCISFGTVHTVQSQELLSTETQVELLEKIAKDSISTLNIPKSTQQLVKDAIKTDPRIVGGIPAPISSNLWQVALLSNWYLEPVRFQFCGGSLLNDRWVLTAAHCVESGSVNRNPGALDVLIGTSDKTVGGERINVDKIVVHPSYGTNGTEFDFALLHLSSSAQQGEPIPYAPANWTLTVDNYARVTGWGAIYEGGPTSDILLGAEIPLVSNQTCNDPQSYNGFITSNMFCAGRRGGGLDSCQGDSGGPATEMVDGVRTLVGVVSFGHGCARRLKYGVYARVSAVNGWIANNLK